MTDYPDSIYSPRTKANRSGEEYKPEKESVIFVEDVSLLDDEVVALETHVVGRVATVEDIDLKVVAETNLYTVPTGMKFILTGMIIKTKSVVGFVGDAVIRIRRTSDDFTFWLTNAENLEAVGIFMPYDISSFANTYGYEVSAGDSIHLYVNTGDTSETLTVDVDLIGYLIPA